MNRCALQLSQALSNDAHIVLSLIFIRFYLAQMAQKNDLCAVFCQIVDCRKGSADTIIIRDDPVLVRDIKVNANNYALALNVQIFECYFCHEESSFLRNNYIIRLIFE